ncbi:MAG: hypothetical protein U0232_33170 [Thermomicrobiales bacterium]
MLWWQREKYRQMLVLAIGFFGQWMPWALIPRIAYAYHFLPAAIFGILAVAVTIDDLWYLGERQKQDERVPLWPYAALGVVAIALGVGLAWGKIKPSSWSLDRARRHLRRPRSRGHAGRPAHQVARPDQLEVRRDRLHRDHRRRLRLLLPDLLKLGSRQGGSRRTHVDFHLAVGVSRES